jgi:hypothetical protein
MPLDPRVVEARIVWRVALLRVLAAETFVQLSRHGRGGPCLTPARGVTTPSPPSPRLASVASGGGGRLSVEVRPRRSSAPVLEKVFVELLTVTQRGLRRREQ